MRRASPPYPLKSGQPRAQPTVRAAFGYSRGDWDSTRTLRGHFARAARILRPPKDSASGQCQAQVWTAGAARSVFRARRVVRVFRVFSVDRVESVDRGKTRNQASRQNRKPSDTAAGAPFGRPRCGRLPSLRSAWRQNAAEQKPSAALSDRSAALGSAKRSGDRSPHSDRYAARLRLGAYSPFSGQRHDARARRVRLARRLVGGGGSRGVGRLARRLRPAMVNAYR